MGHLILYSGWPRPNIRWILNRADNLEIKYAGDYCYGSSGVQKVKLV